MTKEAQQGRAYIEDALALAEAAHDLGFKEPGDLARTIKLGKAVQELVRGQPAQKVSGWRFERLSDGIVRDNTTGLEWDTSDFGGKEFTFEKAVKACEDLRTGGHSDWRLPTIQELLSLVDYTRHEPAINKEFFPNCKSSWYRTSTPYAPFSGYSWIVYFSYGGSSYDHRDLDLFVRAVRASQF